MPSSAVQGVPDTQLGLTPEEIQLLRQGQAALGNGSSSSRAASRASSQGVLMLDSSSLTQLSRYFDSLMNQVQRRMEYLSEQSAMFTEAQYDRAGNLIDVADAEIARFHEILRQLDELEEDFDRISNIRDIVRGYRARVEAMERDLESSGGSSSRRHHEHHHSSSSHKHSSSKKHKR
ncbi:hypothetical protein jhhlp_004156 [Lomentospora prolificans]|uniref:Biogenesis of lysosome-related organelles complex 1 subunit CNL1 n=1 Tax=Lomentospora prolificans TaxID=41688 RepID=A0A2N3NAT0_9PEZI|nr:hypothetical protein jhhlp_004156 [Lomentospora prolificans]